MPWQVINASCTQAAAPAPQLWSIGQEVSRECVTEQPKPWERLASALNSRLIPSGGQALLVSHQAKGFQAGQAQALLTPLRWHSRRAVATGS